jgi:hypothetical protein
LYRLSDSAARRCGGVGRGINAWLDDHDPFPGHPAGHEIVPGALAYRVEKSPPVRPGNGPLEQPDQGGDRERRLLKHAAPKEVWHDDTDGPAGQAGDEERDLVDIFDHDIRELFGQRPPDGGAPLPGEAVAISVPQHLDPVYHGLPGPPSPSGADQPDPVPTGREPAIDLVQVDLCPARHRILPVLPIDEENIHNRPSERAIRSRTPFTNDGALAPPNQWAS